MSADAQRKSGGVQGKPAPRLGPLAIISVLAIRRWKPSSSRTTDHREQRLPCAACLWVPAHHRGDGGRDRDRCMGRPPKFKSASQTFLLDLRNSRKLSLVDKCCLLSEETNVPRSVVVSDAITARSHRRSCRLRSALPVRKVVPAQRALSSSLVDLGEGPRVFRFASVLFGIRQGQLVRRFGRRSL